MVDCTRSINLKNELESKCEHDDLLARFRIRFDRSLVFSIGLFNYCLVQVNNKTTGTSTTDKFSEKKKTFGYRPKIFAVQLLQLHWRDDSTMNAQFQVLDVVLVVLINLRRRNRSTNAAHHRVDPSLIYFDFDRFRIEHIYEHRSTADISRSDAMCTFQDTEDTMVYIDPGTTTNTHTRR
jgi:hypothetical protein